MRSLELSALCIVLLFVALRARFGTDPKRFLWRLTVLVIASWVAEDTVIRAYGFYQYAAGWSLFVDHVPLAIVLIWPVVIHSAWELTRYLLCEPPGAPARHASVATVACFSAAVVLADASLIEPIAVQSGLWSWNEPGLFGVPPIGILGWALHAGACVVVLELNQRADRSKRWDALCTVVAPLTTHLLLLVAWWTLFRWISRPLPPWPMVAGVWVLSLLLATWAWRSGARKRVPSVDMLSRIPAAGFFFVLLGIYGAQQTPLLVYACAFAPPYLILTRLANVAAPEAGSSAGP